MNRWANRWCMDGWIDEWIMDDDMLGDGLYLKWAFL